LNELVLGTPSPRVWMDPNGDISVLTVDDRCVVDQDFKNKASLGRNA